MSDRIQQLNDLAKEFSNTECDRIFDLRWADECWCVVVWIMGIPRIVSGTDDPTPEGAIIKALDKWKQRTLDEPFL